jgi:hypothetical protein
MPGRPHESKARLGEPGAGCLDSGTRSKSGKIVETPFAHFLDVPFRVDCRNVLTACGRCLFKTHLVPEGGKDTLDSPCRRCRVPSVDLFEVIVRDDLHRPSGR